MTVGRGAPRKASTKSTKMQTLAPAVRGIAAFPRLGFKRSMALLAASARFLCNEESINVTRR